MIWEVYTIKRIKFFENLKKERESIIHI